MDKTDLKFSDEYKTLEILKGEHKGTYKAEEVAYGCGGCAFNASTCALPTGSANKRCIKEYKVKGDDTVWTANFNWIKTEEAPKPTTRPHADLIIRWGSDADLRVWSWRYDDWYCNTCPAWDKDIIYAVSTEKPTHTPMKMYIFTLIGKEYPITLPANLSESEVESKIKERVFEITEFSYKEV